MRDVARRSFVALVTLGVALPFLVGFVTRVHHGFLILAPMAGMAAATVAALSEDPWRRAWQALTLISSGYAAALYTATLVGMRPRHAALPGAAESGHALTGTGAALEDAALVLVSLLAAAVFLALERNARRRRERALAQATETARHRRPH